VRILSHYFIARYLGLFLTVLTGALILLIAVEFVLQLDAIGSSSDSFSTSPSISPTHPIVDRILAYYLPDLLPVVSFIASFLTFAWAGRSLETLALQAGGIRIGRVILPVMATALMLSLATVILHETLVLGAERTQRHAGSDRTRLIDFGQKEFWFQKGRTITNVAQADAQARTLEDVEIFERGTEGRIDRVVRAERVYIADDGRWNLENARIWQFDADDPTAAPRLEEHARFILDLETLGGAALLGAEPGLLPIRTLASYLSGPNEQLPSRRRQLLQRFHQRLSRPWLVALFAWLAIPFSLRIDGRGRFMGPALQATGILALFFFCRGTGATLVAQGVVTPASAAWWPLALFALGTSAALRRRI
jgi:lipopolysaccharide export system permease protein